MPIYRSDMGSIIVSVNGNNVPDSQSWDYAEGGDLQPEMQTYNPGAMQDAVAAGGLRKRADMTVRRVWGNVMASAFKTLDDASGNGTMQITFVPKNPDGTSGSKITYTGMVGKVTRPNYDAATSTLVYLEVAMSCNTKITVG